ncbi:unnamed protein product [Blepharisma stoltei]|uniref:Uncharacterized protein n=1 Tax=Blepharisma stoltei TaxID=1481888 RepID=A0AAU9JRY6_9CILI|nr:unnamed protein product [Blepharisma stoltei]
MNLSEKRYRDFGEKCGDISKSKWWSLKKEIMQNYVRRWSLKLLYEFLQMESIWDCKKRVTMHNNALPKSYYEDRNAKINT